MGTRQQELELGGRGALQPFSSEEYVQGFANHIAELRAQGYYFVPFVGAGLSVPAGIPQAATLTRYLRWCFLRVLGLNPWAKGDTDLVTPTGQDWTPRKGLWPDLAEQIRRESPRGTGPRTLSTGHMDEVLTRAIRILESGARILALNGQRAPVVFSAELAREVYGAVADWRTALLLLSRIDHETLPDKRKCVVLKAPDQSVRDSFFQFHMGGKQPCQGHRMIAALAPVLSINLILTPNFDDLIELAFAAISSPLKCFEVPQGVPLPDARLVTRQRSIVKLHGGSFGLRADYSIDEEPDLLDSAKFLSYLACRPIALEDLQANAQQPNKIALVMCGLSGKDQRVMAMLRRALETFPNLKLLWFCHTERDVLSVCERFRALPSGQVITKGVITPVAKVITIRHIDYGALLHQIYQRCTNSIPSAGVYFPSSWHMPSAPRIPAKVRITPFPKVAKDLWQAVEAQLQAEQRRPVLIPFENGARGGVTLLAWLFWQCTEETGRGLSKPVYPIWLDLDDVATPAGVFLRLALALARRGGTANPISSLSLADFYDTHGGESFREVLVEACQAHHARTGECLLVCINAQDELGNWSPFQAEDWQQETAPYRRSHHLTKDHGWFADPQPQGIHDKIKLLVRGLADLNREQANGVQFVLAARKPPMAPGNPSPMAVVYEALINATLGGNPTFCIPSFHLPHFEATVPRITTHLTRFDPDKVAQAALDTLARQGPLPRAFLHLMMRFRFAAFEASLVRLSERLASELGEPEPLAKQVRDWLAELARHGVIRWRIGGVIWIKGEVREKVLAELRKVPCADEILLVESLQARWYGRLLLATSDPLAATECLYHAFDGVWQWLRSLQVADPRPSVASLERLLPCVLHAHGVLNTASAVLAEQLSDQFADHTLALAEASVDAALKACVDVEGPVRAKGLPSPPHPPVSLQDALDDCQTPRPAAPPPLPPAILELC